MSLTSRALRRSSLTSTLFALAALCAVPRTSSAQENYEIQVYGSETIAKGRTMYELHSNFTFDGPRTTTDGTYPVHHSLRETVEITHGFTSWSEVGFYLFTSKNPGHGLEYAGIHIRPRVRAPESWKLPVGLSLSQEFGPAASHFSEDSWTYELRPIIDKQMGNVYVSVNPVFGHALRGPNAAAGWEFTPNVNAGYDVTKKVNLALEYYGGIGHITDPDPSAAQSHQLFYVLNLELDPDFEFNLGYGRRMNDNPGTEKSMIKLILGRRM